MKIKNLYMNLYVVNLIIPGCTISTQSRVWEESFVLSNQICRKKEEKNKTVFTRIEDSKQFPLTSELGYERVDKNAIIPLTDYYTPFGFKKKNNYPNKGKVYQKVKELKRRKLL